MSPLASDARDGRRRQIVTPSISPGLWSLAQRWRAWRACRRATFAELREGEVARLALLQELGVPQSALIVVLSRTAGVAPTCATQRRTQDQRDDPLRSVAVRLRFMACLGMRSITACR